MARTPTPLTRTLLLCTVALLAACNSNDPPLGTATNTSTDTTTNTVTNLAPVAAAGADRAVSAGDNVELNGTGSTDDSGITSFAWSQTGAPGVSLTGTDTPIARFVAPVVTGPTVFNFTLTVTDAAGATGTDAVAITVNPLAVVGRTFNICLDAALGAVEASNKAQDQAIIAFFDAREGDTIQFCAGQFNFSNGLVMTGKRGITIKGAGINQTYLRFKDSPDQDGISINRVTGITIQDLTLYDAPGNGLRLFRTDHVTIRGVKVGWSVSDPAERGNPYGNYVAPNALHLPPAEWSANGSYAFYPVLCTRILIEDSISVGSSDAGVYVGQSSDILVRTTEAYHNVAGFEFENTYRAEFVDNIAHDNVGGFLVFDLPGRGQYGEKNQVHHNKTYDNNLKSFAPRGAIVGYVPAGIGMLVLASDQLEIYNNEIYNNDTAGLAIVNFGLVSTREGDRKYDYYPEAMHVAANTFRDNGGNPQLPNNERNGCTGDPRLPAGVPGQSDFPSTNDLNSVPPPPLDCMTDNATLLPAILVVKNSGKSAHIVWDGGVDPGTDGFCTEYPKDGGGVALNLPNPDDFERYESRADERGRPNYYIFDPDPACASDPDGQHHAYNAWKFDEAGALKPKVHGLCIEMDGAGANTFEGTLPNTMLVDPFLNAHFSTADPTAEMNQQPAENTVPDPATNCPTLTAPLLQQTFPVLGTFTANPANDPAPTEAEIAAACDAVIQGEVNYNALNKYNCPRLNQYGLFQNKADPRSAPNGFGVPFNLNTALFSDYAVKYRVLYLPPQAANPAVPQKAGYADRSNCKTLSIFNCNTATLEFPTGTVFAKTFAFRNGANEDVVETRLLIKRPAPDGSVNWTGMAYLWEDNCAETGGTRCARLKIEGARKDVSWDYEDEDAAARNLDGSHPHYTGSTRYGIPSAGACLICHSADDKEAGAAPIGPKVRNLNKNYDYGGAIGVRNQLTRWSELGLITLPDTVEAPLPKWNVPGSGVPAAANPSPSAVDVSKDKHMRARSFVEVNCMHCHNSAGYAQNSGLGLDANDALLGGLMGQGHGICKTPIAAGKAAENVYYDIVPADSAGSLLFTRLSSATAGIMMPPMARSVTQAEAMNLVGDWINTSVSDFAHPDANTCSQGSGTLPVLMGLPSP